MEVYEVTASYFVGEARWLRTKPHDTSSLNGLSLVIQIALTNKHEWWKLHVNGSHFDSVVPDTNYQERDCPSQRAYSEQLLGKLS